ncbi:TPA: AMP-binding protein [Streptococcus agalactiae]|uniref:AMP-binding protein n=3 Tax=Streptococcus agalactiae TaxID=1311 RepID=UPI001639E299|nr:AMP-binding protein [Streptococcus agalactiae]HEO6584915.1 AMP-binding protein [Streptococcus agalactiae]HEO6599190.1 AMP-binding protein [Streptococcus agalactiae]HEO6603069.1 AMP-binding protein [Streptococcus agalactiae]HEO6604947.1 AMP-binding protein [Streptococcus agalactiae]HEO6610912.1 AMP-binding protein [Streptococcus agalactiae]
MNDVVVDKILRVIKKNKNKNVYDDGELTYTYGELDVFSDIIWQYIDSKKGNSNYIATIGNNDFYSLCVLTACIKSGYIFVPIDSKNSDERIQNIIDDIKPKVIIRGSKCKKVGNSILFEDIINRNYISNTLTRKKNKYMYVIYTSGTTGIPKGVPISYSNIISFTSWFFHEKFNIHENERILLQASFSFDLSVMSWLTVLWLGKTLVAIPTEITTNYKKLRHWFNTVKFDLFISTPSFAYLVYISTNFNSYNYPWIKKFIFCGEEFNIKFAQKLVTNFKSSKIFNTYGPTECTVAIIGTQITESLLKMNKLPIGKKRENIELIVGAENELQIVGDMVFDGYLNRKEETAKSFIEINAKKAYKTGDKVRILDNGYIFFDGRNDNQIKKNGYRIELEEVECIIKKIPEILNVVVLPIKNEVNKIVGLSAFIVLEKQVSIDSSELLSKMQNILPLYMIPNKIHIIDEIPLTNNKKINRKLLELMN